MAITGETNALPNMLFLEEPAGPVTPAPVPGDGFRVFLAPSSGIGIGGSGTITGTLSDDSINVRDVPGTIMLDASFNRGGDVLRLAGLAQDWQIGRSGSNATLDKGDTHVIVPVGQSLVIIIDDDIRFLRFDSATGNMLIGDQIVDAVPAAIQSPPFDGNWLGPDVPNFNAVHRLFLSADSQTIVSANQIIISGTNEAEHVTFQIGKAVFDASFNRGGDTLTLPANAADLVASVTGSSVHLTSSTPSSHVDLTIPVGPVGLTLDFADGDRTLIYNEALGQFRIGDQVITGDPTALLTFA